MNNKVFELHPVVSHHKGHGGDYCSWVLVVEVVECLGTPQVFLGSGDALLHSNASVHANCVLCEDQCIWEEGDLVEFFLQIHGVLEVGSLAFHNGLELFIDPLSKGVGEAGAVKANWVSGDCQFIQFNCKVKITEGVCYIVT